MTLADRAHWDDVWANAPVPDPTPPDLVLAKYAERHLHPRLGQRLIELGAGNTRYLPLLAGLGYQVAGLDYSPGGVAMARRNLEAAGVDGDIREADLFDPPGDWLGRFDVVSTFGVAEHFEDTNMAISAFARYLAPGGRMLTVIPNMRGLPGVAQRFLDRDVYEKHVPLTPDQLAAAHERVALEPICATYVVGFNGWVVNGHGWRWRAWMPALALTRALWALGDPLRPNRLTSPWVVVVAQG